MSVLPRYVCFVVQPDVLECIFSIDPCLVTDYPACFVSWCTLGVPCILGKTRKVGLFNLRNDSSCLCHFFTSLLNYFGSLKAQLEKCCRLVACRQCQVANMHFYSRLYAPLIHLRSRVVRKVSSQPKHHNLYLCAGSTVHMLAFENNPGVGVCRHGTSA